MKSTAFVLMFLIIHLLVCGQDSRTLYFHRTEVKVDPIPQKDKVWVFILAGQSNMAGRGLVEAADTIPNERILTINRDGALIVAKEPLHFYEPAMAGLDCGLSFGRTILSHIPADTKVLLIPTAVGGSSISQWLGDSVHRGVKLLSNFREKVQLAGKYGDIKAILWHQGESDANSRSIPMYEQKLTQLFSIFRQETSHDQLPILVGHLGSYSQNKENWSAVNTILDGLPAKDQQVYIIRTADFKDKGDHIHFDSEGQRMLGERFGNAFLTAGPLKR